MSIKSSSSAVVLSSDLESHAVMSLAKVSYSGDSNVTLSGALSAIADGASASLQALEFSLGQAISAEEAARIAADSTLTTNLAAEATTARAAEAAIQADVDANELDGDNDRAAIRSEFAAADAAALTAEVARAAAALTASEAREATIQADVDANELDGDNDRAAIRSEFAAADGVLTADLASEVAARGAADTVLQGNIAAEATTARAAEASNAADILLDRAHMVDMKAGADVAGFSKLRFEGENGSDYWLKVNASGDLVIDVITP